MKPFLPTLALGALLTTLAGPSLAQKQTPLERGKYLMDSIVACGNCHLQRGPQGEPLFDKGLSGGMVFDEPPFKAYAANITPDRETGIGAWTDAEIGRAIREGVSRDGRVMGPPMPFGLYRGMSDADLAAIIAYLRTAGTSEYRIPLPPSYGPTVAKVDRKSVV